MSNLSRFMKNNKIQKKNEEYAPTKSMLGSDGKPLRWEFKHISSKLNESIRDDCTIDVQVKGKPNMYRPKLNTSKYLVSMIVASTVTPDLYNKELQDSYGVKKWWMIRENIRIYAHGFRISRAFLIHWMTRWKRQKTNKRRG